MCNLIAAYLHSSQSDAPTCRGVSPVGPACVGGAGVHDLGWSLWSCRGLSGWGSHHLHWLLRSNDRFLFDGCVLRAAENRGGVGEWRYWPGDAARSWAALSGCAGGSVSVLLPAERVDPAGAVAGGEGGQGQRRQPHVLPWGDQLTEAFLVGEGVAWPAWAAPGAQAALGHTARTPPGSTHSAACQFSLLQVHKLSVADLGGWQQGYRRMEIRRLSTCLDNNK